MVYQSKRHKTGLKDLPMAFPSPGRLPDPGIKTASPVAPALAGGFFTAVPPRRPY